ncbi:MULTISPECIES: aspartate aminotransferase [Fervidobacterium]|uniref:Aminotransferase class I and II n=1 Tax=Fervidobacterium nodosum (strain ATCC 35602 / DSM 5306 / Rt17-B1) TaxID=381764 RepID=A7HLP0_FERNB|nr:MULTISPECIES: aspartate aminotransferase [Fervidobacterium]ABS60823.1 aminotransferase class I and II [Fervidobacterium nodosum Rt17-B1]KAF2962026.1 aspartate aminotransferase [Fervidobacterium sp. 2310opik-2]PHJ14319.1 aspartate aminotransferase [Fervidobacterium sp. SC_NGM5_G05]
MHPVDLIAPSKTLEVDSLAKKLISEGKDVVNLTAGEPDFQTPRPIIEEAINALNKGLTKYTDSNGILPLREAISKYLKEKKKVQFTPDEIVVSNGGKQALFNAFASILDEGDEAILFAPYWVSYPAQITMVRAKPVVVRTSFERQFVPTVDELLSAITLKTKLIVVNSPNNPSGGIYDYETMKAIADIANEKRIYVISDEVYDDLVYEGNHVSMYGLVDDDLLIYVNAFSKSHAMTGWRVGYVATKNKDIKKRISKIQSHLSSNINTTAQYAAIKACETDNSYMIEEFKKRRKFVVEKAEEYGLSFVEPKGAFYLFFKVKGSDEEFCKRLLSEKLVATVPGSAFDMPGFVRMSFATNIETLDKGLKRIKEFMEEWDKNF